MGLTGFNRARREAEAKLLAADRDEASLPQDTDPQDTEHAASQQDTDVQPLEERQAAKKAKAK